MTGYVEQAERALERATEFSNQGALPKMRAQIDAAAVLVQLELARQARIANELGAIEQLVRDVDVSDWTPQRLHDLDTLSQSVYTGLAVGAEQKAAS